MVEKSDMITVDNITLEFSSMGIFETDSVWMHPDVTVPTYEIIYVTDGQVNIAEGEQRYELKRGDMLLLDAGINHRGYAASHGKTSFYWLHYTVSDAKSLAFPKLSRPECAWVLGALRELMHLSMASQRLADIALAKLLFECIEERKAGNPVAHEIDEYIRLKSDTALTVSQVAQRFRLSADHIARLLKKEFGYDTKTAIVNRRLLFIKSCLVNTDKTVKEIAAECGFEDENSFVKFFKYHEKTTPTAFRSKFFYVNRNNK